MRFVINDRARNTLNGQIGTIIKPGSEGFDWLVATSSGWYLWQEADMELLPTPKPLEEIEKNLAQIFNKSNSISLGYNSDKNEFFLYRHNNLYDTIQILAQGRTLLETIDNYQENFKEVLK